jgi:hypothetical protein
MAASDASPFPIKNQAYRITFPLLDADGDLVSGGASDTPDSEVSIDGGTFADCTNEITEIATSSGMYYLDLTAAEMNGDTIAVIIKTATAGTKTTPIVMYPVTLTEAMLGVNAVQAGGTAWASGAITAASIAADAITEAKIADNAIATEHLATGAITADTLGTDTITAAKIAANAIGSSELATDAIGDAQIATGAIASTAFAAGAITASAIATDAIGAAELAADAVTEIQSGLATSAEITALDTVVDRVEADTQDIQSRLPAALVSGKMDADATAVSGSTTAADNLQLMYDGTGYTDSTAPSSRSQIDAIGAASGGSLNYEATSDNASSPIKTVSSVGTQSGTYANTESEDASYHQITHATNDIDWIYGFAVGGGRTAVEMTFKGYLTGANDSMHIEAYDFVGADWEVIATLDGQAGTDNVTITAPLLSKHTGTGSDIGNVYIRFDANGAMTSPVLNVDQLLVAAVNIGQSVGYSLGAIWYDDSASNTNSEAFVDGVADNPVSDWAAVKTLITSVGISRVHISSGSTVTLDASSDGYELFGDAWSLALGTQSIDGMVITGATVTGVGEATTTQPVFRDCSIGAATIPPAKLYNCGIGNASGTFTAPADSGEYILEDCFSEVPGSGAPVMTFAALNGVSGVNIRRWSGGLTLTGDSQTSVSVEVLAGGGVDITTNGGDTEIRGTMRSLEVTMSSTETVQFVGTTGPITLDGTTTGTVNLHGISTSLSDSTSGATVTDNTLTAATQAAIETDTQDIQSRLPAALVGGLMSSDVTAISTSTEAADKLELSTESILSGTASGTPTTTTMISDISITDDDQFKGRIIIFSTASDAGLVRQATDITACTASTNTLTFTAVTVAPSSGDTFIIV